ncbi:MAG: hypothetical protein F6K00_33775 [Leptolyngbya sp. SIOISBB]|nr:hypothetical protein [Leptolyngbya sp. SIOISBB]
MTEPTRFVLDGKEPVPCENMADWQAFMDDIDERTVAQDVVGKFHITTTFEGINLSNSPEPRFFLTVVAESEDPPFLSETWEQAESKHRAVMRCAEGLSDLTPEKIANGHRFIDYGVEAKRLWFVMESEETAIATLPEPVTNWHREGSTIVFTPPVTRL